MPEEPPSPQAQQSELASLRRALEQLQARNQQLEAALAQAGRSDPPGPRPGGPPGGELAELHQALRQSEEKFRLAFLTNPDPCCITRARDGAFIEFNEGFLAVSGYSRQELLAGTSLALNLYPDPEVRGQLVKEVAARGRVMGREVNFRTKGGRLVTTLMSLAVFSLEGEPHILSNLKVIDELKQALGRLAESEARYRRIVETANEGIWVVDSHNCTTFVNQRLADMLGYAPREMLGRPVEAFVAPQELADLRYHLGQRGRGVSERLERRYLHKHGQEVHALVSATAVMDGRGGYAGAFAMVSDITERKRAEAKIGRLYQGLEQQVAERTASLAEAVAQLRLEVAQHQQARQNLAASRAQLQSVLEGTPAIVLVLDTSGRITFVSRLMPGQTLQNTLGSNFADYAHPDYRQTVLAALNQALASGQTIRLEALGPGPQGTWRWHDVSFSPIKLDGRVEQVVFTSLDIHERKLAQEALSQSEERFAKAFDANPLPMGISELGSGRFVEVNAALARAAGLTRQQMIGRDGAELGIWDGAEQRQKVIDLIRAGRHQAEVSVNLAGHAQPRRQGLFSFQNIRIHDQDYTLTSFQDLTKQRLAEEALRQSEELYRLLVESAHEGILVIQDGLIKFYNQHMVEMAGLSLPEDAIKPFIEYVHPDDRAQVLARYQKRLAGDNTPFNDPVRILDKHGGTRWVIPSSVCIQWQGRPAYLGFFTDITEAKRFEQELRASQERYRLLSENAQDLVILRDHLWRPVYVSPSVKHLLGYEPEEFLGLDHRELIHPDDLKGPFSERLDSLRQDQMDSYAQLRIRRKDGSYLWLEALVTPLLDEQDRFTGSLSSSRDISQRRRAEDALLHLAAGVAHNFNNVLMASLSNAQAAQGLLDRGQSEPERLALLLQNVVQATLNGRDVVHRLSRFVSGRQGQTSSVEVVDLGQLLAGLPGLVEGFTAPGQMRLDLAVESGLLVRGAPGELMEVFLNLAKNAAEAMPHGGALEVTARGEGKLALVQFQDNGVGASAATLARFFEPFFSTKGAAGQGLGLSVSLAIAHSHGGDLSAQSQPGQGATLTLRLPLCQESAAPAQPGAEVQEGRPLKVLLVEDEGLVAMGMTMALEGAGHEVLHVVSVAGALSIMEQFRPDLAICDLGLPDASGWEVCLRLASQMRHLGLGPLPLVVLSGWGREQLGPLPARAPEPFAYLQKPVERAQLLNIIARAAASR